MPDADYINGFADDDDMGGELHGYTPQAIASEAFGVAAGRAARAAAVAQAKTCRACGQGGLLWKATNAGWRLFDPTTGTLHICSTHQPPTDNAVLVRLQHYVQEHDLAEVNCPMGISLSANGYVLVKYTTDTLFAFKTIQEALAHIDGWLKHN